MVLPIQVLLILIVLISPISIFGQTINDIFEEGIGLKENKKYNEAIAKFSEVVKKDKYYHEAWYHRAICHIELRKTDEALQDLSQCIAAKKDFVEAYLLRARLYTEQNKAQEAINDLNQVIRIKPNHIEAYEKRASLYLKMPDKNLNAINDLQKAAEFKTSNPWTYIELGKYHINKNKFQESIEYFTKAIELDSKNGEWNYWRGNAYNQTNDALTAIKDYSEAINKGYKNQDIIYKRAKLYFEKQIYDNALTDLTTLIAQYQSKQYDVYVMRGVCYSQINQTTNAIKDFSKAITLAPNKAEAFYLRACEYLKQGKTKEPLAIKDFNKSIELEPNNHETYIKRAIYYYNKQKYAESLEDINKSIKIKPTAEAVFYKGAVLYEMKKFNEACLELKKSAQMDYEPAKKRLKEVCPMN